MNKMSYPNMFNKNNRSLSTCLSYNVEAVNESLKTMFYVNEGELLGDPSYGTRLRERLFDLKTPVNIGDIKTDIVSYINKYIPGIYTSTDLIKIYIDPNNTRYKINITYKILPNTEYSYFEVIVAN